ncbi:hypothetical protein ABW19_dt0203940 [Dactylella cylindrospora]|nr:hypothetical protein ABW19_dt0203940 [Dactylella cylindrospora]
MGERGVGVYVGGARIFINDSATPQDGNWYYPSSEQVTTFNLRTLNRTTTGLPDSQKRMGAALAYLPIGSEGAIIGIGGTLENEDVRILQETGMVSNIATEDFDASNINFTPMQRVWIMDLATRKWHSQSTFGTYIPDSRMEHCIGVVSAPDNSSHNIYMFGGSSGSSMLNHQADTYYNDLYILSLPSFRWIRRSWTSEDIVPPGRVQHTCHVYGKNMVILGGATNKTDQCSWDELNILDLTSLRWVTDYHFSRDQYEVPEVVMGSISNNGKVQTEPVNGWDDHELEAMFGYATGDSEDDNSMVGKIAAIAGGVAGGVVVVLALVGGFWFWRRRTWHTRELKRLKATAYEASRSDPSRDNSAMELHDSPSSYTSTTMDYGSGYAHPGKLWRESYHSYELSDGELDPMDQEPEDDSVRLIGDRGKIPTGYFELGDPSTPIERHELGSGGK